MSEGQDPARVGFALGAWPRDFTAARSNRFGDYRYWTSGDLPGTHGFAFGPGTALVCSPDCQSLERWWRSRALLSTPSD
jgi:hypothetical protein